jgi:hypothetical protein
MRIREISESWGFTDSKVLPFLCLIKRGCIETSMLKSHRAD